MCVRFSLQRRLAWLSGLFLGLVSIMPLPAAEVPPDVLRSWQESLRSSEEIIDEQSKELTELRATLALLQTDSDESARLIARLKSNLAEQSQVLTAMRRESQTLSDELREIETRFGRQSRSLLEWEKRVAKLSSDLRQWKKDYSELVSRYDELSQTSIDTLRQTERNLRLWKAGAITAGIVALIELGVIIARRIITGRDADGSAGVRNGSYNQDQANGLPILRY